MGRDSLAHELATCIRFQGNVVVDLERIVCSLPETSWFALFLALRWERIGREKEQKRRFSWDPFMGWFLEEEEDGTRTHPHARFFSCMGTIYVEHPSEKFNPLQTETRNGGDAKLPSGTVDTGSGWQGSLPCNS